MRALIQRTAGLYTSSSAVVPGLLVCIVVALASSFVSEHYGGPTLLYALLIGIAFNFLSGDQAVIAGINFCGRTLLRAGVALLGARITFDQVAGLGVANALQVTSAVFLTIGFGVLLSRLLRRPATEGVLSGGAVAICGASAALAISAALPQSRENDRFTLLAVVGVTVLSTVSMVLYPLWLGALGVSPIASGIFLGATVHDVAQVVAAAAMLGPESAETAAIVKLFRVAMLAPIALLIALSFRRSLQLDAAQRPPVLPGFLIAFIVLVAMTSGGMINAPLASAANEASRWLLVIAIAASGMKTNFGDLRTLGWTPVVMLVLETAFLAGLVGLMLAFM